MNPNEKRRDEEELAALESRMLQCKLDHAIWMLNMQAECDEAHGEDEDDREPADALGAGEEGRDG